MSKKTVLETSLIKLNDAVDNGQSLYSGSKVVLFNGDEAEIYGFIAISDPLLNLYINMHFDMPPLGECQVFSNRVIFYIGKQQYRYPVFKSVHKVSKEKYKLYLLYIPKLANSTDDFEQRFYKENVRTENPKNKYRYQINIERIKLEDGIAYYYTNPSDLFFESRSKLNGIGEGFVVITRRFSKLSDEIKYELFDSHSVMIEKQ